MRRLGIFCLPGRGHLYPITALGRRLEIDGFEVTVLTRTVAKAIVSTAGLRFKSLDNSRSKTTVRRLHPSPRYMGPHPIEVLADHAQTVLDCGLDALAGQNFDALIIDQADLAAGSVAERAGIPFINVSMFPPIYLSDSTPPFIFDWHPRGVALDNARNRRGNELFNRLLSPVIEIVSRFRTQQGLNSVEAINDLCSPLGIITQLPKSLDFPRTLNNPYIYYSSQFYDDDIKPRPVFPWSRVQRKRLIYACMGTVRTSSEEIIRIIAEACSRIDVQLIISLGGMWLIPEMFEDLPGDPIVVHFAPQMEVLKQAALCITHGGLNTVLESARCGVPMVVIPITDDQPGVAARVVWHGLGFSISARRVTADILKDAIVSALESPSIAENVNNLKEIMRTLDGVGIASTTIQALLGSRL